MMRYIAGTALMLLPLVGFATDGIVSGATVTTVRAYETNDGSTRIFIALNNHSRVGPNPDVPSVDCELWTYTKQVFSVALAAKASGQKVNVVYVPGDTSDAYCKVRYFEMVNN